MNVKLITAEEFQAQQNQLKRIEEKLDKITPEKLESVTYSPEEVCKILDVSPKTLQNYRDTKKISFSQVGPKIWFTAKDVEDFLSRYRITANLKK